MTLRTVETLTFMRLPTHDIAFQEGQLLWQCISRPRYARILTEEATIMLANHRKL